MSDNIEELKERIMQLEYEAADRSSELLRLRKENERLYQSVRESMEQVSVFRSELHNVKAFYDKRLRELAEEKAKTQMQLDVTSAEFDRINSTFTTVSEEKNNSRRESLKKMDAVRETSMDAVTMIDYIDKDIRKLKLDLFNMSKDQNTTQQDIEDEIQLMLDLLNEHSAKLAAIKSGFYSINNITMYDNTLDDLTLTRNTAKLENGNYVD
ncbi:MAG: hypothetical protein IIY78_01965 [Clostridia bacterium]|nr:hypothetical protein [Clostridia bacterium]